MSDRGSYLRRIRNLEIALGSRTKEGEEVPEVKEEFIRIWQSNGQMPSPYILRRWPGVVSVHFESRQWPRVLAQEWGLPRAEKLERKTKAKAEPEPVAIEVGTLRDFILQVMRQEEEAMFERNWARTYPLVVEAIRDNSLGAADVEDIVARCLVADLRREHPSKPQGSFLESPHFEYERRRDLPPPPG